VNVRLVAAKNNDPEKMIANRDFRSDLIYRLRVFPIRVPPSGDRRRAGHAMLLSLTGATVVLGTAPAGRQLV